MTLRPYHGLLPLAFSLAVSASARAQDGIGASGQEDSPRSEWQLLLRDVDWREIERLERRARAYRRKGAIAHFEIHLSVKGPRYDALVVAAIADPDKLARLRGLDPQRLDRVRPDDQPATQARGP